MDPGGAFLDFAPGALGYSSGLSTPDFSTFFLSLFLAFFDEILTVVTLSANVSF
jgi:hypothetical protein